MAQFYNVYDDLIRAEIIKAYDEYWIGKYFLASVWDRRIGKSHSLCETMNKNWVDHDFTKCVLYVRNTQEEIQAFARTFNVTFEGKYLMTKTHIYKIDIDEKGKEIKAHRVIIGLVGALSTFAKLKSQIGSLDFNLVIWDEFNACDGLDPTNAMGYYKNLSKSQYFAFLELIASIEGTNKDLLILLMGNRVNSQNDILLNLGVEIPEEPPQTYQLFVRDIDMEGTTFKIRAINGGHEYDGLHKGNQLFKALATFNKQCESYFNNNDFYIKQAPNVIAKCRIDELPQQEYDLFALGPSLFKMFEYEGIYYLCEYYDTPQDEHIYPLNFEAFVEQQNCLNWSEDDQLDFANNMTDLIKENSVYFSSNWLKYNFIWWLSRITKYGIF